MNVADLYLLGYKQEGFNGTEKKKSDTNTSSALISLFHYILSLSLLLYEQIVHGDLTMDVISIASGLDAIGGDHRQVYGLRCDAYYAVFLLVISRIMCTFAPNSRKEMRQTPEITCAKLPNEQIKLHVYG